jgi:3-hydroxy-9,10-secoandrosta-1,3,5(10)-triene-9,17-dione monooxygenase
VDGGVVLSGSWGFSSGVDVAGWNMLACVVRDGDTVLDYRYCLLRRHQYEIVDDWHTLGMCASGSRTARCSEVFVPDHMTLSMHVARPDHRFPGLAVNTHPVFRVPSSALGGHPIGAAIAGNAQAALDTAVELVKSRSTNYTGAKMRDFQTVQLRIGMAGARIDAAHLLMRNDCLEAAATCRNGGTIDTETRLRYKRNAAMAAKLCTEAIDSLHEMAGGAGIYDSHPLQRMFRDAHAASAHFSFSLDAQLPPWGLVRLGGEMRSPTL